MLQEGIPEKQPKETRFTEELVDHYWGSINYVQSLIRASELKAGLILSFYGILMNFIYQTLVVTKVHQTYQIVFYILLAVWFCFTVVSIYFAVRCFIPRMELQYDKNAFFFKDVISRFGSIKQFSKTFHEISTDEDILFDQLGQQIYIISKIAAIKFKNVHRSLQFLAYELVVLLLIIVYFVVVSFYA